MWLQFIPHWLFYGILGIGIFGILSSRFVPFYYRAAVQAVSYIAFAFGLFMAGVVKGNESLLADIKELKDKVSVAEEQSVKETVKVETKYINKTQVIRERGQDVVQYIDREVVKYDTKFLPGGMCEIPKEFIEAHNKAAEKLK
jgi:hypothetical protein